MKLFLQISNFFISNKELLISGFINIVTTIVGVIAGILIARRKFLNPYKEILYENQLKACSELLGEIFETIANMNGCYLKFKTYKNHKDKIHIVLNTAKKNYLGNIFLFPKPINSMFSKLITELTNHLDNNIEVKDLKKDVKKIIREIMNQFKIKELTLDTTELFSKHLPSYSMTKKEKPKN